MRKIMFFIGAIAGAAFMSGCAGMFQYQPYAREVLIKPGVGGVIALHEYHRPADMTLAEGMMQNNCGSAGYKIVEEGEVTVGTKTYGNTDYDNYNNNQNQNGSGISIGGVSIGGNGTDGSASTQSETTQVKEWHIKYSCSKATASTRNRRKSGRRVARN